MKTTNKQILRLFIFLSFIMASSILKSQVVPNIDWVKHYVYADSADNNSSAIDADNNVYVTGYGYNGTDRDLIVLKYDSLGTLVWSAVYDNGGYDEGVSIKVGPTGKVYVAGSSYHSTSQMDIITRVYSSTGTLLGSHRWDGGYNYNDYASDLELNKTTGYYFVLGSGMDNSFYNKAVVLRYKSNYSLDWGNMYSVGGDETGVGMCLTSNDDVFCTARTYNGSEADIWTFMVDASGSKYGWDNLAGGSNFADDEPQDIVTTGADAVVCGKLYNSGNYDYFTRRIDGSGSTVWHKDYDSVGTMNFATSLIRDSIGNIGVTGLAMGASGWEYHTIMYDSTGVFLWPQANKESTNMWGFMIEPRIAVDTVAHHFYVAGTRNYNVMAYQITPFSGSTKWTQYYNGPLSGFDYGTGITVSGLGIVYVSANCENSIPGFNQTTIRISQTPTYPVVDSLTELPDPKYLFYKNEGQITTTDGTGPPDNLFYTHFCQPEVYVQGNSFYFVDDRRDTILSTQDSIQRIHVTFPSANSYAQTFQTEFGLTELNYFQAHCGTDGITGIKGASRLMCPNIFHLIDLNYYSNENGLKLYFVLKPGADKENLIMHLDGATSTATNAAGQLVIKSFKTTQKYNVYAYQTNTTLAVIPLAASPTLVTIGTNTYKILLPAYTASLPLIVRVDQGSNPPKALHLGGVEWSTTFGGTGYDEVMDVKTDNLGNSYWAGRTNSDNMFPVANGLTNPYTAGMDAFVAIFGNASNYPVAQQAVPTNPGDALMSMTYYGGTNHDGALGVAVTGTTTNSDVYLTGYTNSSDFNTKTQSGFYNQTYSGGKDAFVVNLKYANMQTNTVLFSTRWSTYLGGTGEDEGHDIKVVNTSGLIHVGGVTSSAASSQNCSVPTDNGFPNCNGAFNTTNNGNDDGFIATLNTSTGLTRATFVGGSSNDTIKELAIASNGDIYFVGSSNSSGASLNPVSITPANSYTQTFNAGGTDAIFGRITPSTPASDWLSFFGGDDEDYGNTIILGLNNNFFIGGTTSSENAACSSCYCAVPTNAGEFPLCPKTNATNDLTHSNSGSVTDGFLAEFGTGGAFTWGTYRGGDNSSPGGGDDCISSISYGCYGALAAQASSSVNALFFAGMTNSRDYNSVNDVGACMPWMVIGAQAMPNAWAQSDGWMGIYSSSLTVRQTEYIMGHWSNNPPIDVSTQKNSVHVFGDCHFYGGKTTNYAYQIKSSFGYAGVSPVTVSPFANSMTWNFKGPANYNSTVDYEPDATLARFRLKDMPMYVVPGFKEQIAEDHIGFNLYPNPSQADINVYADVISNKNVRLTITNMLGQIVYSDNMETINSEKLHKQINISNFSNGVYCLTLSNDTYVASKLFIKQ